MIAGKGKLEFDRGFGRTNLDGFDAFDDVGGVGSKMKVREQSLF